MTAYRLVIPGMVCGCAVESIERTLRNVAGVCGVEPETLEHAVRVDVETDFGSAQLIQAVERVGYQVAACSASAAAQAARSSWRDAAHRLETAQTAF